MGALLKKSFMIRLGLPGNMKEAFNEGPESLLPLMMLSICNFLMLENYLKRMLEIRTSLS